MPPVGMVMTFAKNRRAIGKAVLDELRGRTRFDGVILGLSAELRAEVEEAVGKAAGDALVELARLRDT